MLGTVAVPGYKIYILAYLGYIAGSVIDHCDEVNIVIKRVKYIFVFTVHI